MYQHSRSLEPLDAHNNCFGTILSLSHPCFWFLIEFPALDSGKNLLLTSEPTSSPLKNGRGFETSLLGQKAYFQEILGSGMVTGFSLF